MVKEAWLNDGDEVITEIQWNNYLRLLQFEKNVKTEFALLKQRLSTPGWQIDETLDDFKKGIDLRN